VQVTPNEGDPVPQIGGHHTYFPGDVYTTPTVRTLADGDVTVTPNSTPANAVDAEVRGRFFIARNVPLDSKADNSIVPIPQFRGHHT
jgi:hypothetical protein